MKLCYVTVVRLPTGRAHGYAIMKMCEQFAAHGAHVELIVPKRHHGPQDDPFEYYGVRNNFALRKLWATDFLGRIERTSLPYFLDLATFLISLMARKFPDDAVVYTRDYQVALVARSEHIILEIHNVPDSSWLFERAIHRVEKFVVITQGLKDALVARGIAEKKIVIAPDAVDLFEFDIMPSRENVWRKFGVNPDKKIALYTGHFYEWKGADVFAKAARFLPNDLEIIIMGGVDAEFEYFKKTYASSNVHIIPLQKRMDVPAILKSADILILPNSGKAKISSHYTSPLKLFQYMASGTSVVASDLPSIREILDDSTAFWFRPDDEQSLAKQIQYALAHPEEAREKAARAKEAAKKYTWDARASGILKFIEAR